MANSNISNLKQINSSYDSVEQRMTGMVSKLKSDYEEFKKGNAYYKKVSNGALAISILIDIALIVLLIGRNIILEKVQDSMSLRNIDILSSILFWIILVVLIFYVYKTAIQLYCKKIDGYERRLDKLERKVSQRISDMKNAQLLSSIVSSAEQNKDFVIPAKNDIGAEIARISASFTSTNQRVYNVKRMIDVGVSAAIYLLLIVYMLFVKDKLGLSHDPESGFRVMLICFAATTVINFTQFNAGQYMEKFSKLVGIGMAAIYGVVLCIVLKSAYGDIPVIELHKTGLVKNLNTAYIILPVLQVLAISLIVCLSHYGLEKEKWQNGFNVEMAYGAENRADKKTMFLRGGISAILTFAMFFILANEDLEDTFGSTIIGILWYCANALFKPRGSHLYAFWGSGRCIANEVLMAVALITTIVCAKGIISMEQFVYLGVALIVSFGVALVANIVNNFMP